MISKYYGSNLVANMCRRNILLYFHIHEALLYYDSFQETEQVATLAQILETSIVSPFANVALTTLKCALIYLQNHAENLTVLAVLVPYLLKLTQLDEMLMQF